MLQPLKAPFFSVIIATYNSAKTLNRAIESVLKQVYKDYEIIVIDDGSKDDTKNVVLNYGEKVRYFFQENAGVSAARNLGANSAIGDWLTFLDADDWYYPERLQWHAELLYKHPEIDFLLGDYHFGKSDGSVIRRSIESYVYGQQLLLSANEDGSVILDQNGLGSLLPSYFGHTTTFTLPKETFNKLGGYPQSFSIGEDIHLLIRLCAISRLAGVVCKPMAFYCVHDKGLIRSDVFQSQFKSMHTIMSLKHQMSKSPKPIRDGYLETLLNNRYDTSVSLLRNGYHLDAIKTIFPSIIEFPSLKSLKLILSIVKG